MTKRYISTGSLPDPHSVQSVLDEARASLGPLDDGEPSDVYPSLSAVDPELFGLCVVGVDGRTWTAGDALAPFTIMSVAKPFTFALVCELLGPEGARERIGVDATGLPFNSAEAVERRGGRTNPMVNAGAIATVDALGRDPEETWTRLRAGLSAFAGRELQLDDEVLACARATNQRNRALAHLLDTYGLIDGDPAALVDVYTRQSCLTVTSVDLAVMGATLANGGVNPLSGARVAGVESCHATLAVMTTAGLYECSGDWLYRVGLPGKSGIGGGIVTVAPGKGGLGTYSPPLDSSGNSVRGRRAAELLSVRLGLDLFASAEAPRTRMP